MENPILFCITVLLFFSCKEEAGKPPGTPSLAVTDTAVGVEGSEKAKFDGAAFTYAAAKVKVTDQGAGETIEIDGTKIPGQEADFFSGVYRNYLFIDNGTGPNGRNLKIWSIGEKKVIFETPYEGDLSIKDDKLNFIKPIDLSMTKLPAPVNCPDAENWKKEGLGVGYGIPSAYDFSSMTVSATSDVTCFAVQ
jgi:hypothetical protein